MIQYSLDNRWVFDTGNDLNVTAALTTGFNFDIDYSLQPLRPSHVGVSLCRRL
jgi:hypothetical protein